MALSEFGLIDRFFRSCGAARADADVGIGDDGAVLTCPPGAQLVAAIDSLVAGIHFPSGSPPASIGHRALAVNLSDLAAMGAEPAWALLALTLPAADEAWLTDFASGFCALAKAHGVALVGGDTTSGPLAVTVQVLGVVPRGRALLRSGATAGDGLYVSGTPGDAAAGLLLEKGAPVSAAAGSFAASTDKALRARFLFPTPRVDLGKCLREIASACIDVSDGLLADARKLAEASGCGVEIDFDAVPVSTALVEAAGPGPARRLALTGGDDYELCFAVPAAKLDSQLTAELEHLGCRRIGTFSENGGATVRSGGTVIEIPDCGFDHFARA